MTYRLLTRRVWAMTRMDIRTLPASTSMPSCVSACHPSLAQRPLASALSLSRHLSITPCRYESFSVQDAEDFTERVINSTLPVLVDFHAQWCGPCKILGPRLEKAVAKQQGRVTMAKVDIDDHTDLAIEYGVSAVPTVLAMKEGNVIDQFVGIKDEAQLDSFINKLIGQ